MSLSKQHLHWIDVDEGEKECLLKILEPSSKEHADQWIEIFDTCSSEWHVINSTVPSHLEEALMWNDMMNTYNSISAVIVHLQQASEKVNAESKSIILSNKNPLSITHMYKVS